MYMYYDDIETSAESSCCMLLCYSCFCTNLLILIRISVRWLGGCLDCFVEWLVSWFVSLWLVGELLDWFMVGWIVCRLVDRCISRLPGLWLVGVYLVC